MPPKQNQPLPRVGNAPCEIDFTAMAADLRAVCMMNGNCLACRHPVVAHIAAQAAAPAPAPAPVLAAVVDPLLRQGPSPCLVLSPAEGLRQSLQSWQDSARCLPEDLSRWRDSFETIKVSFFDGHAQVVLENVAAEGTLASRKFLLRNRPDEMTDVQQTAVGCALRRAHYLGVALWHVFRMVARHEWKVEGRPGYVLRSAVEIPVAVHIAEEAIAERLRELLGHRLPQLEQLSDPKYPMWLGIFAGTLPIETLQSSLEEIFRSRCAAWRTANSGAFCNTFERENEIARSRPLVLQMTGATPRNLPGPSKRDENHQPQKRPNHSRKRTRSGFVNGASGFPVERTAAQRPAKAGNVSDNFSPKPSQVRAGNSYSDQASKPPQRPTERNFAQQAARSGNAHGGARTSPPQ